MSIEWEPRLEDLGRSLHSMRAQGMRIEFVSMNPSPERENDEAILVDVSERVGVGKRAGAAGSGYGSGYFRFEPVG